MVMGNKISSKNIITLTIVFYFFGQSFYIIFKKWTTLDFEDKITVMETLNLTILAFFESVDVLIWTSHDSFFASVVKGELFGYKEGLINKKAYLAFFSAKKLLEGAENSVFDVNDLQEKCECSFKSERKSQLRRYFGLVAGFISFPTETSVENDFHGDSYKIATQDYERKSYLKNDRCFCVNSSSTTTTSKENVAVKSLKIIQEHIDESSKIIDSTDVLMKFICTAINILPLHSIISYFLGDKKIDDLKSPILTFVPFSKSSLPENIEQFILSVVLQNVFIFLFYKLSMDMVTVEMLSYSMLKTEMDLFMNTMNDFGERIIENYSHGQQWSISEKFKRIIVHHQEIQRKLRSLSNALCLRVLYMCGVMCSELCIAIFLLQGNFFSKVKYGLIAACILSILALNCEEGQTIENKMENISESLYQISWHNLSVDLRKSLHILLSRHSKPTRITAFGILFINRANLATITRASYSYFNLLNKIK